LCDEITFPEGGFSIRSRDQSSECRNRQPPTTTTNNLRQRGRQRLSRGSAPILPGVIDVTCVACCAPILRVSEAKTETTADACARPVQRRRPVVDNARAPAPRPAAAAAASAVHPSGNAATSLGLTYHALPSTFDTDLPWRRIFTDRSRLRGTRTGLD